MYNGSTGTLAGLFVQRSSLRTNRACSTKYLNKKVLAHERVCPRKYLYKVTQSNQVLEQCSTQVLVQQSNLQKYLHSAVLTLDTAMQDEVFPKYTPNAAAAIVSATTGFFYFVSLLSARIVAVLERPDRSVKV